MLDQMLFALYSVFLGVDYESRTEIFPIEISKNMKNLFHILIITGNGEWNV